MVGPAPSVGTGEQADPSRVQAVPRANDWPRYDLHQARGACGRVNRGRVELAPPPSQEEQDAEKADTDPTDADFANKTAGQEWVVKQIVDHDRDFDGTLWFLVDWLIPYERSWHSRRNLDERMVAQYFSRLRKREENSKRRTEANSSRPSRSPPRRQPTPA